LYFKTGLSFFLPALLFLAKQPKGKKGMGHTVDGKKIPLSLPKEANTGSGFPCGARASLNGRFARESNPEEAAQRGSVGTGPSVGRETPYPKGVLPLPSREGEQGKGNGRRNPFGYFPPLLFTFPFLRYASQGGTRRR